MKLIEEHQLCVKAGSNENDLQIISVNDESRPIFIDSEHFTGYILVRMLNFQGITDENHKPPLQNPPSNYFKGRNRLYSIVIQGQFKQSWNGDDIIFGGELVEPLAKVPMGASLVIKACKWLDPGIECDAYADRPYMFSPLLCAMNAMTVTRHQAEGQSATTTSNNNNINNSKDPNYSGKNPHPSPSLFSKLSNKIRNNSSTNLSAVSPLQKPSTPETTSNNSINDTITAESPTSSQQIPKPLSTVIGPFKYGNCTIIEDCTCLFKGTSDPPSLSTYEKRKKYFLNPQNRAAVEFSANETYAMDFYDAYADLNSANVKLPGVSLSFWKFWQGIPINFVAKTRDGKTTFFLIQLSMVPKDASSSSSRNDDDEEEREEDEQTVSEASSSS